MVPCTICRQMLITVLFWGTFFHLSEADLKKVFHLIPEDNLTLSFEWNEPGDNATEADYLYMDEEEVQVKLNREPFRRAGWATETHSCGRVRAVPYALRSASTIGPRGLHHFYQKYTEAYNIPVLGSTVVSDAALTRACYVVRFLLAGHSGVRQFYYKLSGRVAIMAQSEVTTSIPEHAWLGPSWNQRARGLGATIHAPVSTGGEENVLCHNTDRYRNEDIFLHEFSHGIHLLGAKYAIPGWDQRLRYLYRRSRQTGLWRNTYSMSTPQEYFAEAVQSYFEVNAYSARPNGIHGPINTRAKLQTYDPELYALVKQVFPCENFYIKRCNKDRDAELYQRLKMNCNEGGRHKTTTTTQAPTTIKTIKTTTTTTPPQTTTAKNNGTETSSTPVVTTDRTTTDFTTTTGPKSTKKITLPPTDCLDRNVFCANWAQRGECRGNPAYMLRNCRKSCNHCDGGGTVSHCRDYSRNCGYWSRTGECGRNPVYMMVNCKRSCNAC